MQSVKDYISVDSAEYSSGHPSGLPKRKSLVSSCLTRLFSFVCGATSNRNRIDIALSFSKLYLCYDVSPLNKVFTALHRSTQVCILGTISEYKDNYFILLMTYSCKESDSSAYWANIDIALLSPIFKFTFFFFKQEGFPPFSSSMILCKKTTKQCISYFPRRFCTRSLEVLCL